MKFLNVKNFFVMFLFFVCAPLFGSVLVIDYQGINENGKPCLLRFESADSSREQTEFNVISKEDDLAPQGEFEWFSKKNTFNSGEAWPVCDFLYQNKNGIEIYRKVANTSYILYGVNEIQIKYAANNVPVSFNVKLGKRVAYGPAASCQLFKQNFLRREYSCSNLTLVVDEN